MSCRTSDGSEAGISRNLLPQHAIELCREFDRHHGHAFLAGGSVRDMLLGHTPKDVDIEVYGIEQDRVADILSGLGKVELVGKQFGVFKLWRNGHETDIAIPRTERKTERGHRGFEVTPDPFAAPETASLRRDFTINAMMYDPLTDQLFDFHGGCDDLQNGTLRHVSPAFAEDPLRVLRAMQFAARFKLIMDPQTAELCRQLIDEAETIPSSRIWIEWQKWCHSRYPSYGLRVLLESGWIDLYPELAAMIGCPQDPRWHPEGDVWVHTLLVVNQATAIADRYGWSGELREQLLLAALCHDLGKPVCTFSDDNGILRSPGHSHEGRTVSERFLNRIAVPRKLVRLILPQVQEHMTHMHGDPTPRAIRHLANRLEPATIEMWEALVEADASGRAPSPASRPALEWLTIARDMEQHRNRPAPIVSGEDVIRLGIPAGPRVGRILNAAYRAQLDGEFTDAETADAWLQMFIRSREDH